MKISVPTLSKTLENLVRCLETELDLKGNLNPRRAREIVLEAKVQEADLQPYATFDHPLEDNYGRTMIYQGENFEVMAMSWNPGDYSSIHNHGYTQWGVVQSFGNAHHFCYRLKDQVLSFSRKEILTHGTAIKVNNALIHQMGNPGTDRYQTLHVYGAAEFEGDVTADAKNFELESGHVVHTTGGAFFNLPADQIYDFEPGLRCTSEVFLHHAHLLLSYYNRLPQTPRVMERKQSLLNQMQRRFVCTETWN